MARSEKGDPLIEHKGQLFGTMDNRAQVLRVASRGEALGRITTILVESRFLPSAVLEGLTKCTLVRPSLKCSDSQSEGLTVSSSSKFPGSLGGILRTISPLQSLLEWLSAGLCCLLVVCFAQELMQPRLADADLQLLTRLRLFSKSWDQKHAPPCLLLSFALHCWFLSFYF